MYWLYSMPNLLTFQKLDTLYLGGNHVRVVCENVKNSSVCAFREVLATGSCEWLVTDNSPTCHTCEACKKLKGHDNWSTLGQKGQSDLEVILWLKLATQPSSEWVARTPYFVEKCLFTFVTYPTINTLIPTKCREFPERILREKP